MKNFVKAIDKTNDGFLYLRETFTNVIHDNLKKCIFIGPQIKMLATK